MNRGVIEELINGVVKRPFSVLMVSLGLVTAGFAGISRLKVEYLPPADIPVIEVIAEFPELPQLQMEELVTVPLENALSSVSGVRNVRSMTRKGICSVTLTFGWEKNSGRDIEVRERIDTIFPALPRGVKKPLVRSSRAAEDPFMLLAVYPDNELSAEQAEEIINGELKTMLLSCPAVSFITVSGIQGSEIVIEADRDILES